MYATEFQTVINDQYIKIPEYESFKGQKVRIIVLNINQESEKNQIEKDDFINYLIENPVNISKNMKFLSREEANER